MQKMHLTYRKSALTGHEAQVKQLLDSSVSCHFHTTITKLIAGANHESIERVELTNHETGEATMLPVDGVIINHGYERDSALLENSSLRIERSENFYIAGQPEQRIVHRSAVRAIS
ncbi:NAD(P)/FAD-dependent oxidoreductase [Paenibacillus sp. IB182493]|uniref:NAD(P)/FAD-dependent oxidoreductase n=1 Tax=Paenibacillus arenilitoris TaxID=2772299 RepID=A0A927CHX8_9BACL|nr:NAD(P)/FAD-dependent oxidoreductase [Paenibacillus arenilitoris]